MQRVGFVGVNGIGRQYNCQYGERQEPGVFETGIFEAAHR